MDRIQGWIPLFTCNEGSDWSLGLASEANSRGQLNRPETSHLGAVWEHWLGPSAATVPEGLVRVSFNLLAASAVIVLEDSEGALMF